MFCVDVLSPQKAVRTGLHIIGPATHGLQHWEEQALLGEGARVMGSRERVWEIWYHPSSDIWWSG